MGKEVVMMNRLRRSMRDRLLLKGPVALALVFAAATQLATPAAADDGYWWRQHHFADHHRYGDRGRFYVYSGPRAYYYGPPAYYYPAPPPPPAYYYPPPGPSFSFGLHVR
jgi:hypothetical protein